MAALGVVLMLVAALLNATASVLQRRADRDEPASAEFSLRMVTDLLQRPVWLLGIVTMLAGFILHAVSISLSQIALVQPLLIAELPFTLLLASRTFRVRIPRRDWIAIAMASLGLAAFVAGLAPSGGAPLRVTPTTWVLGIGITAGVIAGLVVAGYRSKQEHRAALLGVATGAAFGVNSSLIAGIGAAVGHGGNLVTTWQTYGVLIIGPASFFLLQNALAAGNLVASQPALTLTNPLVAVAFGLVVFGEHGRSGFVLIVVVAGAGLIAAGTILLSRSRLLDPDATHATSEQPRQ